MAPENHYPCRVCGPDVVASMRPGLDGPGKRWQKLCSKYGPIGFNEAGAGWPRKTNSPGAYPIGCFLASMRPGLDGPGKRRITEIYGEPSSGLQ